MARIIDLTYRLEMGMVTLPWPHHPITEMVQTGRISVEGSMSHKVTFGTHTGTHLDSPCHMLDKAHPTIDEIPVERLMGKAKLMRLEKGKDEIITAEDLKNHKIKPEPGDRLLICTGWGQHWNKGQFYRNFPTFSLEAVEFLVECKVKLLGMDTPSPDSPLIPVDSPMRNRMHKTLMHGDVLIIETLANLDDIPADEFDFIALPLKAKGLDGFPVRAIALID